VIEAVKYVSEVHCLETFTDLYRIIQLAHKIAPLLSLRL
jgi:hypothetical protein